MKKIHIFYICLIIMAVMIFAGIKIYYGYKSTHTTCLVCGRSIKNPLLYCDEHRCITEGCNRKRWEYGQGIYCRTHENEYNPRYCQYPGCSNQVFTEYDYCSEHKCSYSSCENVTVDGTDYCDTHQYLVKQYSNSQNSATAKKSYQCQASGCYNIKSDEKKYCTKHACAYGNCSSLATYTYKDKHYCSTHYKMITSNIKIKEVWPDCDDYEDLDEFLDDWEGNMPDGSDAEDYWDEW